MRFSTRIFLASAAVSTSGVLVVSALAYLAAEQLHRGQYNVLYRQRLEMLARDFQMIEETSDRAAANAARVVRERLARSAHGLSQSELTRLASELGVSVIAVANLHGDVVAASDRRAMTNLFAFCPASRALAAGTTEQLQTPLIADRMGVSRSTLLRARSGVVLVGVRFSELGGLLQKLADDESDIDHVVLKAPDGRLLGEVRHRDAATASEQLRVTVATEETDCLETSHQPYSYEFVADVSLRSFRESVDALRGRLALVFALVWALAAIASLWIARRLSTRIAATRAAMDEIARTRDFSLPIATAAHGSGDEIDALAVHFNQLAASMRDAQRAEARAAVAAQVAHDIRSPLTAMTLALGQLQSAVRAAAGTPVHELCSTLASGVSRVTGIVNRLAGKDAAAAAQAATPAEPPRLTLIDKLVSDVVQEHALKNRGRGDLSVTGFEPVPGVWAVVQPTELQAAVSNVVNNAFEAIKPGDAVRVSCALDGSRFKVDVTDDGVGISADVLARVFERAFTSGKAAGTGLGLYQAKTAVEWCGGAISITSKPGQGTTVSLAIPVERAPAWLASELKLAPGAVLVVADDDPAVLDLWRAKAAEAGAPPPRAFASIAALDAALEASGELGRIENLRFVVDQFAGEGLTGLALIEKRGLGARAVLCTSEFDDPAIQDSVKRVKAKMIAKPRLKAVRLIVSGGEPWTS